MSTPLSTPVRQVKLGLASSKSTPLTNDFKKIFNEQYQRLSTKHQQDLELIEAIRSYVKTRLSIEHDYTSALSKLSKQHATYIAKKFPLLNGDQAIDGPYGINNDKNNPVHGNSSINDIHSSYRDRGSNSQTEVLSLYKVWSEHVYRLQATSKNRAEQFDQISMIVDKLKDIRSHKVSIGKKCLDNHLKRIHEDVLGSIIDVDRSKKLYYEDESQAKKARENEEKIKKKRSGLLTKFTDLQAKKEKTSAQREANDIQSTQARNDYIMALAAANAHLQLYYQRDLDDFIHTIDDGVLDHCKVFMATLSECDICSLKDSLLNAQSWSQMINSTGSQKTNNIFLEYKDSDCLRMKNLSLEFEPCNNDPIQSISLEHNADYALQHEIDKWFTWFKKECRNLSQLMHQLDTCQKAFSDGRKTIELNNSNSEDLETKIVELKQQIRKCEAAKLKAQARLKVIKEGGMQIEEWSAVELEIRNDMARIQEKLENEARGKIIREENYSPDSHGDEINHLTEQIQLHITKNDEDADNNFDQSRDPLASVSRSTSNLIAKQQNAVSGLSALADPSSVWQDDLSSVWGNSRGNYNVVVTNTFDSDTNKQSAFCNNANISSTQGQEYSGYNLLSASNNQIAMNSNKQQQTQQNPNSSMTVQSSSPLSAVVDGEQTNTSPYQGMMGDNKSDYECDYNRNGQLIASASSSADPYNSYLTSHQQRNQIPGESYQMKSKDENDKFENDENNNITRENAQEIASMINRRVIAMYSFEKTNEDDLEFNENDILRVIHVEDADWVRARNEKTGKDGYIPTSYVRLLSDEENLEFDNIEQDISAKLKGQWSSDSKDQHDAIMEETDKARETTTNILRFCRALYDYTAESNTFEEDGLPHLSLVEGEMMEIIHEGDDGWWLVKKENTGDRGHVPSMLVEEVGNIDEDDADDVDGDDEDPDEEVSAEDNSDDDRSKSSPNFAPPTLPPPTPDSTNDKRENDDECDNVASALTNLPSPPPPLPVDDDEDIAFPEAPSESTFIESANDIEEDISTNYQRPTSGDSDENVTDDHEKYVPIGVGTGVSSSREDFGHSNSSVDEPYIVASPNRRPSQQVRASIENNTISEENLADEVSEAPTIEISSKIVDRNNYEPLSEVDSLDTPAPPSVVIENYDDGKDGNLSSSFHDDGTNYNDDLQGGFDLDDTKEHPLERDIELEPSDDIRQEVRHESEKVISEAIGSHLDDILSDLDQPQERKDQNI